jgi:hypothetical protein
MTKIALALSSVLLASVAYGGEAARDTGDASLEPATLVIYRSDADLRSRRLSFDVRLDSQNIGRIRRDNTLVVESAPGSYTLDTSLPGEEPIILILQPGATYYVETGLRVRGDQLEVNLQEVGEQVARTRADLPTGQI